MSFGSTRGKHHDPKRGQLRANVSELAGEEPLRGVKFGRAVEQDGAFCV